MNKIRKRLFSWIFLLQSFIPAAGTWPISRHHWRLELTVWCFSLSRLFLQQVHGLYHGITGGWSWLCDKCRCETLSLYWSGVCLRHGHLVCPSFHYYMSTKTMHLAFPLNTKLVFALCDLELWPWNSLRFTPLSLSLSLFLFPRNVCTKLESMEVTKWLEIYFVHIPRLVKLKNHDLRPWQTEFNSQCIICT